MQNKNIMAEIKRQDFDEEVINSRLPVFACFTSSRCRSCFALRLVSDDLAKEYEERVKFVIINVDENPRLATKYHIIALPTVLIFQNSKLAKRLLGFHYKRQLRKLLDSMIAKNIESEYELCR